MIAAGFNCGSCGVFIQRQHISTFIVACAACSHVNFLGTTRSVDSPERTPAKGAVKVSGRQLALPSVLHNARKVSVEGNDYTILGLAMLVTTGPSRLLYVLADYKDKIFYLFECLGEFYLADEETFDPVHYKTSATGTPLEHDGNTYIQSVVERVDAVVLNGEIKFVYPDFSELFLLFTFEKNKRRLLLLMKQKQKKGLVLQPVAPEKIVAQH